MISHCPSRNEVYFQYCRKTFSAFDLEALVSMELPKINFRPIPFLNGVPYLAGINEVNRRVFAQS